MFYEVHPERFRNLGGIDRRNVPLCRQSVDARFGIAMVLGRIDDSRLANSIQNLPTPACLPVWEDFV